MLEVFNNLQEFQKPDHLALNPRVELESTGFHGFPLSTGCEFLIGSIWMYLELMQIPCSAFWY